MATGTTLSHDNIWLHRMLTDQGACTHEHSSKDFEDTGDGESGPHLIGSPAFDRYTSESHEIIIDGSGTIVHCEAIDWDFWHFCEGLPENTEDWPEDGYVRQRKAGEDWQVRFRDEDGGWWSQDGGCWTSDRAEAHFFHFAQACQIAHKHNHGTHAEGVYHVGDCLRPGQAVVYHADDCVRCMVRKRQGAAAMHCCGSCGEWI